MSLGFIEAGRAFVRLMVNDEALQKGLKKAQAKLKMFAASTGTVGRQLIAASSAMAAPIIAGTKVYADFEQQMANVSTMLDNPAAYMQQFSDAIKRMQVEFGETSEALAGGLYDILSASIPASKALDVLEASTRAAKAGLTDTKTAADAITTILNSYGMSADQAGQVSDMLFTIVKRGKTTFAELAPNIGKVTSVAATAGVGLDELGAMLATLTRNGLKTEDAITAVANVIQTFLNPSDEAVQIAKDLGFEMNTATIRADGLAGVFERIAGLPPEAISKLFPNIRAIKGLAPALNNLQALTGDIEAMRSSTGATEDAFGKMSATISNQFNRLWQAIQVAANEIGAAFSGTLSDGTVKIQDIAEATADWIKENQGLVVTLGKTALITGAVGGALLVLSAASTTAAVAMGGLKVAVTATSGAFSLLLAHPAVAVIAGIAVAVGALAYMMEDTAASTRTLAEAEQIRINNLDRQQAADKARFQRLQALARQESLSADQQKEAANIIKQLESVYGDLGITLDSTTGKVNGLTDAYGKMTTAMSESLRKQLKSALMEARANQAEIAKELEALDDSWINPGYNQQVADLSSQAREWASRESALMERYRALLQDDPSAGGSQAGTTAEADDRDDRSKLIGRSAFQADLDKRLHEARIQMIDDEEKRELESLKLVHQEELKAAKEAQQDITALELVQMGEIVALEREQARKREEDKKDEDKERKKRQQELAAEIEDLEIGAKYKKKSPTEDLKKQIELLEAQRRRAVAEAKALKDPVDAINKKFDLLKAATTRDFWENLKNTSVSGTFSAQMATRMGGSSVEERQLRVQETIAENTEKTVWALSKGGFVLI